MVEKTHSYHIWTIGCQMNKAESERLGSLLEQRGYRSTSEPEKADLIILNTCVVRESAENRVINKLHTLRRMKQRRPGLKIAVTGCFVSPDQEALVKAYPQVDFFFMAGELPQWLHNIKPSDLISQKPPVSVYIPIMQGCNNFCSYCIVPYRRGRERSRPVADILEEAQELVHRGAKEIVLLGQNVDSYGHDLPEKPDLADLLLDLHEIEDVFRLRFLTSHPKDMKQKLIHTIASLEKVCEHINLPIQAGDDEILKAMKRGYSVAQYRRLVADIRESIPHVALSTDIIVGFPGESEEQFQHTVELLTEVQFDTVHVACYSSRVGTLASKLPDSVSPGEKDRRLHVIETLQEDILTGINSRLLGRTVEVLVEGKYRGKWRGRTRSDKLVFFEAPGDFRGKLVNIVIAKTGPWSLQGILKTARS